MDSPTKALADALEKKVRDGLLGPIEGKATTVNFVADDATWVSFGVGLFSIADLLRGIDNTEWNIVQVAKSSEDGELDVLRTKAVALTEQDIARIIFEAHLGTVTSSRRISTGACSSTYAACLDGSDEPAWVVQMRLLGNVRSMNSLQEYIREMAIADVPVPRTVPAASPSLAGNGDGLQLQITEFVPGPMANKVYYDLDMDARKDIVRQMARAHAAIWELPVLSAVQHPAPSAIGEVDFEYEHGKGESIAIKPARDLGGPFPSASAYLDAWIRHHLGKLEEQQGVDVYKEAHLLPIRDFVNSGRMVAALKETNVNDVPIVIQHADLGLHNVILTSSEAPCKVRAIIDWEFIECRPFVMAIDDLIEPLFDRVQRDLNPTDTRLPSPGDIWAGEATLRAAFWDEIPKWREHKASQASVDFCDWYSFGRYLKANALPKPNATLEEKQAFWARSTRTVTGFLKKWGSPTSVL